MKKDIDTANTQGRNTSQAKEWRQRDEEPITGRGEEGHFWGGAQREDRELLENEGTVKGKQGKRKHDQAERRRKTEENSERQWRTGRKAKYGGKNNTQEKKKIRRRGTGKGKTRKEKLGKEKKNRRNKSMRESNRNENKMWKKTKYT